MAHHFKVEVRPHKNKDGSDSKTKKTYIVRDRARHGVEYIGETTSKADVPKIIDQARQVLQDHHLSRHPNDKAFRRKHGVRS